MLMYRRRCEGTKAYITRSFSYFMNRLKVYLYKGRDYKLAVNGGSAKCVGVRYVVGVRCVLGVAKELGLLRPRGIDLY